MSDTVTLSRAEYEALLTRLEDAEDAAAVAAHLAREEALGSEMARANSLPVELVERLIARENPIRIWRLHRKLTQAALARNAGVSVTYLNEIEAGKKPGSAEAINKLAQALGVAIENLSLSPETIGDDDDLIRMLDDRVPWIFPLRGAFRSSLREALELVVVEAKKGNRPGPLVCVPRSIAIEPDQLWRLCRRIGV